MIIAYCIIVIFTLTIYAPLLEYLLHRHVMHKPLSKFTYPFDAHARTHHRIFRADETYHLIKDEDKWTIPMAWWNGLVLALIAAVPGLIIGQMIGITAIQGLVTVYASVYVYYLAYESIHWCMHLPKSSRKWIEDRWFFKKLNGHHLLHHRYMHKNFNVVFPVWDLFFGTLLLRSPMKFAQPIHPSVPNVQPQEKCID